MKIYKLNATANDVIYNGVKTKCVEIFAFAKDENDNAVTICCEMTGDEHLIFVYDGEINTSDPGEGPTEEYANREEALASEYGDLFKAVFDMADNMK